MRLKNEKYFINCTLNKTLMKTKYIVVFLTCIVMLKNAFAQVEHVPMRKIANAGQINFKEPALPIIKNSRSLVQLNDSIYRWAWDTLINDWNITPVEKTIDMFYNADNNITNKLVQDWSGNVWWNDYRYKLYL
jgi:hypothetical protein